jgi:hypothetical protein
MQNRRRLIGCAVGAFSVATLALTLDGGAARATGAGCRGLSPASAQDCTADELRAALDR